MSPPPLLEFSPIVTSSDGSVVVVVISMDMVELTMQDILLIQMRSVQGRLCWRCSLERIVTA